MKNGSIKLWGLVIAMMGLMVVPALGQGHVVAGRPKLVVNVVVGQMRYDYLLRFADNFSRRGFNAFLQDGVSFQSAHHDYLFTCSAAGLSTLATGANPSTHGVSGDVWYDYGVGRRVEVVQDRKCFAVGADDYDAQVSPRSLLSGTLGDALKGVSPMSKVVSVAWDPQSAVVMGGFTADEVYWVNPKTGCWISSTYYMDKLPEWVTKVNDLKLAQVYSEKQWTVSRLASRYHNVLRKDIVTDTTGGFFNFDFLMRPKYDFGRLAASPYANSMVKDFAVQSVIYDDLGKDENVDLLNVVFDASRTIGQRYGSHSMEVEDSYYRLDADIEQLLDFLDRQLGRDNVLVVLSADHGAADPATENSRMPHGRFNATQFAMLVNGFLGAKLGADQKWVVDFCNNQIYLNRGLIYEKGHDLAQVQSDIAGFAIQFRGVAQAITSSSLQSGVAAGIMGKAQDSYFPRRSGDVMINLLPGWMVENDNVSQAGTGYNYDSHVPLMFWGAGVRSLSRVGAGPGVMMESVQARDVAPTVARIIGVAPPNSATGRAVL